MNTDTLHFRVGADMGIILMQIAHEHLVYNQNVDKAIATFTESFGGEIPEDLLKQLLIGEQVVLVDEEEQMFNVVLRAEYPHLDDMYPKLDLIEFAEKKNKELEKNCKEIDRTLDIIIDKFRYTEVYNDFRFSTAAVVAYLYGDDEVMQEEIRDDYNLNQMQTIIRLTKQFIEKSMALKAMFERLGSWYGQELEFDTYDLYNLAQKVKDISHLNFTKFVEGDVDSVAAYLEATREIDEAVQEGLEPVDILDNYSAGWLSPEGEYYALNGEIANMLHNQIADALQEQGIVPENDDKGMEQNPDAWLEQQGWLRIHDNNVQFAGCLNNKIGLKNINMTEKQIEVVRDYITNCYACVIKAGWRREQVSIGMFTAMALKDPIALNKKYFNFD